MRVLLARRVQQGNFPNSMATSSPAGETSAEATRADGTLESVPSHRLPPGEAADFGKGAQEEEQRRASNKQQAASSKQQWFMVANANEKSKRVLGVHEDLVGTRTSYGASPTGKRRASCQEAMEMMKADAKVALSSEDFRGSVARAKERALQERCVKVSAPDQNGEQVLSMMPYYFLVVVYLLLAYYLLLTTYYLLLTAYYYT